MKSNNTFTKIFTHEKLPFLELRYSNNTKHYKEHIHDTFSLGINLEDKSIYTNKDKKYDFDVGMIAVVNPNEVHSCNPIKKTPNLYYMLYLDEKWCTGIQNSICDEISAFKTFPENIIHDINLYNKFKTLCENIFSDIDYNEKEDELINFFTKLFGKHLNRSATKVEDPLFDKILDFLNKNYKENISLEELSSQFNLNPFYIIRLFKSNINMTPHAYLLNIKINRAKELLKKGLSIVDTALECGFSDQSHFHRNFLRIVATTPKSYQDNFKVNFIQE